MNGKDKIIKILSILGYSGNKEAFADELIELSQKEALIDLLNQLPQDKKTQLMKLFEEGGSQEKIKEALKNIVGKKEYLEAFKKSFTNSCIGFIKSISNTLSENQKKLIISSLTS